MDYIPRNSTSILLPLYFQDMSSPIGAGLTGIVPTSTNFLAYFQRDIDASPTNIPLATLTMPTYTASGIIAASNTNAPGDYWFGAPNTMWANSGNFTTLTFYGANNLLPLKMKFMMTDANVGYMANSGINKNSYTTMTELGSVPVWPLNPVDAWNWLAARATNQTITTSTVSGSGGADIVYKQDGTTTIGSGVFNDNGSSFTRNKYS